MFVFILCWVHHGFKNEVSYGDAVEGVVVTEILHTADREADQSQNTAQGGKVK